MPAPYSLNRRRLLHASALSLGASLLPAIARADTIADIKQKGKIVIGIQGDNPPWGFVNSSGVQEGFDCALTSAVSRATHIPVIASGGAG